MDKTNKLKELKHIQQDIQNLRKDILRLEAEVMPKFRDKAGEIARENFFCINCEFNKPCRGEHGNPAGCYFKGRDGMFNPDKTPEDKACWLYEEREVK